MASAVVTRCARLDARRHAGPRFRITDLKRYAHRRARRTLRMQVARGGDWDAVVLRSPLLTGWDVV